MLRAATETIVILALMAGVWQFRSVATGRRGNQIAAAALLVALAAVLTEYRIFNLAWVLAAFAVGGAIGWVLALRMKMIQIPAMVAFQHGCGGLAASFVASVELVRMSTTGDLSDRVSGCLGLVVGAATFSASMIAGGKLSSLLKPTPSVWPGHNPLLAILAVMLLTLGFWCAAGGATLSATALIGLFALASVFGIAFAVRVGGADMPVMISLLNATAGLAAAFCGMALSNRLLIACGAMVAASGSILTHAMCKAMNRGITNVLLGSRRLAQASPLAPAADLAPHADLVDALPRAVQALGAAKKVLIIPGYGMALAQAQSETVRIAEILKQRRVVVKFAIHPVAGRMPGHMHVLLAEANVDSDLLFDMAEINHEFSGTDVALIVGACDVVNPAAISTENTPISGMPILAAHEARQVVVCNLDDKPGYSGVPNPLYQDRRSFLLFGDAKLKLRQLISALG